MIEATGTLGTLRARTLRWLWKQNCGENVFSRIPTGSLCCSSRNLRKSAETSGSLRENEILESCTPVPSEQCPFNRAPLAYEPWPAPAAGPNHSARVRARCCQPWMHPVRLLLRFGCYRYCMCMSIVCYC